jgi:chitinase
LKVILSLGGWGGCETCSDAFFTSEGRQEFARSVKELNDYFKTDGIDLDWEYPTVRLDNDIDKNPVHKTQPEDRKNFTDLVRQLRKTLGNDATITFAAGGFQTYLDKAVEWTEVMKEVDYVNIMSYDLVNGYSTVTGHHTALYSTPQQHESTDNAVKYLIKTGVDPKKIIIGSAFYARVWENVPPQNNGLYQPGKFKNGVPYRDFESKLSPAQGFTYYWDSTAQAPYMYNASQKLFATFDDQKSIALKTKYVKDNKLGGIMFWQLGSDKPEGGLLDEIIKGSSR